MCELQASLLNEVSSGPLIICDAFSCYDHSVMAGFAVSFASGLWRPVFSHRDSGWRPITPA
ncbi:hypothetical protein EMIT0196MI5_120155 [Pseudomonas sp. IT-196MI5]